MRSLTLSSPDFFFAALTSTTKKERAPGLGSEALTCVGRNLPQPSSTPPNLLVHPRRVVLFIVDVP